MNEFEICLKKWRFWDKRLDFRKGEVEDSEIKKSLQALDADFDYFGDDEVNALIKEQKAIIESTRAENAAMKDELKQLKGVKK